MQLSTDTVCNNITPTIAAQTPACVARCPLEQLVTPLPLLDCRHLHLLLMATRSQHLLQHP